MKPSIKRKELKTSNFVIRVSPSHKRGLVKLAKIANKTPTEVIRDLIEFVVDNAA